jgi:hypothetical protein
MTDHDISGLKPLDQARDLIADTKLRSARIRTLAQKGLEHPTTLTQAEIQEFSASVLASFADR